MLVGTVHQNVDVEFDNMTGIQLAWNTQTKNFDLTGGFANKDTTFVHIADNTMVFQIGANPLQDVGASIGDMRARALGVNNILVTDRAHANDSIAKIDSAIQRVSSERSKMGALQNRLDHTINNLGVASENLTAAESRIRDLDFAKEMMAFTKAQIMLQAGTAMLAQANAKPQSVLQLLG
jgi:flagellin